MFLVPTYFLPVAELTALYINAMLSVFDEDFAMFVLDDRNGYQPAGVAQFARNVGGILHDDPAAGRLLTVSSIETWICEFVAIEQGAIHQNLGLMCAALGLGGFPHFAAHPFIWPIALGFRTENIPFQKLIVWGRADRRTFRSQRRSALNITATCFSSHFVHPTIGTWKRRCSRSLIISMGRAAERFAMEAR